MGPDSRGIKASFAVCFAQNQIQGHLPHRNSFLEAPEQPIETCHERTKKETCSELTPLIQNALEGNGTGVYCIASLVNGPM